MSDIQILSVKDNTFLFNKGTLTDKSDSIEIYRRFLFIVSVYSGENWSIEKASCQIVELLMDVLSSNLSEKKKYPNYSKYSKSSTSLPFTDEQNQIFWNSLSESRKKIIVRSLNRDMYIEKDLLVFELGKNITGNLTNNSSFDKVIKRIENLISANDDDDDDEKISYQNFICFLLSILRDEDLVPFSPEEFQIIWSFLNKFQKMALVDKINAPSYDNDDYNHRFWD